MPKLVFSLLALTTAIAASAASKGGLIAASERLGELAAKADLCPDHRHELSPILDAAINRVADAASVLSDDERMELVGYANRGRAKVNGPALRSSKPSLSDSQCRLLAREAAAFAKTPIR